MGKTEHLAIPDKSHICPPGCPVITDECHTPPFRVYSRISPPALLRPSLPGWRAISITEILPLPVFVLLPFQYQCDALRPCLSEYATVHMPKSLPFYSSRFRDPLSALPLATTMFITHHPRIDLVGVCLHYIFISTFCIF